MFDVASIRPAGLVNCLDRHSLSVRQVLDKPARRLLDELA